MKIKVKPIASVFKLRGISLAVRQALPYLLSGSIGLAAAGNVYADSAQINAAYAANQLVRQFTLKNSVAQVNLGIQSYVVDNSGTPLAPPMGATIAGFLPSDMGTVPASGGVPVTNLGLPQRDGAGRPLGYCAWNNLSSTSNTSYLAGLGAGTPMLYAVVSAGLNGRMETSCAYILSRAGSGQPLAAGDDYVEFRTPYSTASTEFKASVANATELLSVSNPSEGEVRLVRDINRLYAYRKTGTNTYAWAPVSTFSDDSAANGPNAVKYLDGKVTVADFAAATATLSGNLTGTTATFSGGVTASSFTGSASGLTDLNASNVSSGVLAPAFGGTGVDASAAAPGTLLIGNGSGFSLGTLTAGNGMSVVSTAGGIAISNTGVLSLTGTADQVIVSSNKGDVTLSLPQSIATTSTPTFGGLMLNGALIGVKGSFSGNLVAQRLILADSTGGVASPNVVIGQGAMSGIPSGNGSNTAIGINALADNSSGFANVAIGSFALTSNTTGVHNTAVGEHALASNTTGFWNTAVGRYSLGYNTTGVYNSTLGEGALYLNTTGSNNVAIGVRSGTGLVDGSKANITGSNNTFLGAYSMPSTTTQLNYATAIGSDAQVGTSSTIVLGRTTDTTVIGATGTASGGILQNKILQVTGDVGITGNLTVGGNFTATGFSGDGSGLTNLNAGNISSGVLPVARGGTGLGTTPTNGKLLIGNGSGYTLANITGTANQVNVANGAGSITLSLPQAIATNSTPTFGGLNINGNTTLAGTTTLNVGRGDVLIENNALDNVNGAGITLRTLVNPVNGAIFAVRSALQGARFWVGQSVTSVPSNDFYVGTESDGHSSPKIVLSQTGSATFSGAVTASGFTGDGSGLTNLDAGTIATGTLPVARGGTGVDGSAAGNGKLLIGNGMGYTLANITGMANQVNVANGAGSIALSLPQNIAATSSPTFGGMTLNGNLNGTTANFSGNANANTMTVAQGITLTSPLSSSTQDNIIRSTAGPISLTSEGSFVIIDNNNNNPDSNFIAFTIGKNAQSVSDPNYVEMLRVNELGRLGLGTNAPTALLDVAGTANFSGNTTVGGTLGVTGATTLIGTLAANGGLTSTTGTFSGVVTASAFTGDGSGLTNLSFSQITGGLLGTANGGTGLDGSAAANGQLLIGNGSGYSLGYISGTANQVNVINSAGGISLSLPQAIATTSNPTFGGLKLNGNLNGTTAAFSGNVGVASVNGLPLTQYSNSIAVGTSALSRSVTKNYNVAIGVNAILGGAYGGGSINYGVAVGYNAMSNLTTGNNNTAIGYNTYTYRQSGSNNTLLGASAQVGNDNMTYATAIGAGSYVYSSSTVVLGRTSDTVVIGANSKSGTAKLQVTGDSVISGNLAVSGAVTATSVTQTSDRRLKTNIQTLNNDQVLAKLAQLSNYSYNYIEHPELGRKIGVFAQEVQPLFPEAVVTTQSGFYAVDYNALGAMAAVGVGKLSVKYKALDTELKQQGKRIGTLESRVDLQDTRLTDLESWKSQTEGRLGTMQQAIDTNMADIAAHALKIASNTERVTTLEQVTDKLDTRIADNAKGVSDVKAVWNNTFEMQGDGQILALKIPNFKVSNFSAEQVKANAVYTQRLQAEVAKIKSLQVEDLYARNATAQELRADEFNTGTTETYAGVGNPAFLFAAKADGHYTVNTSSPDGSYATATVIVYGGVAKVVPVAQQGIELFAVGNQVKANAAGKSIKASWLKMG